MTAPMIGPTWLDLGFAWASSALVLSVVSADVGALEKVAFHVSMSRIECGNDHPHFTTDINVVMTFRTARTRQHRSGMT